MADRVSRAARSRIMSRIRSRDTRPEIAVRSHLHRAGLRFRLCMKGLPGRPDIVLRRWDAVVLVHGCFWHSHGCKRSRPPKSNAAYWLPKLRRNRARDAESEALLKLLGWRVFTVWECEIDDELLDGLVLKIKGNKP